MIMNEVWIPVVGFEDLYDVSSLGRVRSWCTPPRSCRRRALEPHDLRLVDGRYLTVVLCDGPRRQTRTVHQLVAEAFLGPRPDGQEIRHLNGDAHDCRVANLRYGTPEQNARDSVRHGTAWYLNRDTVARRAITWRRNMGITGSRETVGA